MLSVQRAKELTATLRFRLVLWITLIVFLMVVVTNIAVREVEQRALQNSYDQFLQDSLEDVRLIVARAETDQALERELEEKVAAYYHRSWFLQLFSEKKQPTFTSKNAPKLAALTLDGE